MEIRTGELLTIKEQQEVMLGIMKAIHTFCVQNNIKYILLYGTLLGAVRHKGFIPWDNDMDIGIPRPDYDKLVTLLNSGKTIGEHFYHLHYTNDDNYHYQIMRICDDRTTVKPPYIRDQPKRMGVWVDIFPIDGVPRKTPLGILRRARLFINKKLQTADIYAVKTKHDIGHLLGRISCTLFPNMKKRNYKIDSILRKTPFETSEFVGDMENREEKIAKQKRDEYSNLVLLNFEDTKFYAPAKWDEYLSRKYGNYMQFPPPNEQTPHTSGCKWI